MFVFKIRCGIHKESYMKRSIVAFGLVALFAVAPAMAQGKRGVYEEVPYNNNPDKFCKIGYPAHNWMAINGKMGLWTVINPYYAVNYQYINTFMYVCSAGGRPMVPSHGAGKKGGGSSDPAATF
ncbi:hypothetical protein LC55x_3344 [Lysobacter capsici]|nr:hypothetical protein LC55x_3344 [Lysobacter capsici]